MDTQSKSSHTEHEIFHDPSGKRWKIIKVLSILLAIGIGSLLYVYIPQILAPAKITPYQTHSVTKVTAPTNIKTPEPAVLASQLESVNVPVIGDGPLIRIDHITKTNGKTIAVQAYSDKVTRVLSDEDIATVDGHDYAIERYGASASKKIALTFDDGPDEIYSPLILDELSKQDIPATFFLVGSNVVKFPEIVDRMAREGHTVANHTFTHINFDLESPFQSKQQINQTARVVSAATGHSTSFFRVPYGGPNDQAMRDTFRGLLNAQQLGYVNASYNFDTKDYEPGKDLPPLPTFDGTDIVALLHDGGGNRSKTVAYLKKLAPAARAHGYTFVNLSELYAQDTPLSGPISVSAADKISFALFSAVLVWPHDIVHVLFFMSAFAIVLSIFINVILAMLQMRRAKHYKKRVRGYNPLVSVLVPAYNEEVVLDKTVQSLLASRYKNIEIIIIDDGSKDGTWTEAKKIAKRYKHVRSFTQRNGGKARALNLGIKKAKGEILICIDADTVFPPDTIAKMVRHFADPTVGAVAGAVKVGNFVNMITRWQALEYTIGIHLERTAQAFLGAIIVVPGACGAWRKEAVQKAGGFSKSTLAEDCDLTLGIQKVGYRVVQDNEAKGYTEVPQSYRTLAKQRYRWIFGNLQAFWKHRRMMLRRRYGWLGMFALPYAMINILLPFVFIPVLFSLMIENINSGQYATIALFAGLTLLIQFFVAVAGITLARERYRLLLAFPITKLVYSPLKTYILFRTALTVLKGAQVGWNKLQRTGNARYPIIQSNSVGEAE